MRWRRPSVSAPPGVQTGWELGSQTPPRLELPTYIHCSNSVRFSILTLLAGRHYIKGQTSLRWGRVMTRVGRLDKSGSTGNWRPWRQPYTGRVSGIWNGPERAVGGSLLSPYYSMEPACTGRSSEIPWSGALISQSRIPTSHVMDYVTPLWWITHAVTITGDRNYMT